MNKNKYSTPLLMLATILAGMLSPMQSAVNGQLGHWLQDGNACAVISFASGLVVMFFIIIDISLVIFLVNSPILPILFYASVPNLFPEHLLKRQFVPKNNYNKKSLYFDSKLFL